MKVEPAICPYCQTRQRLFKHTTCGYPECRAKSAVIRSRTIRQTKALIGSLDVCRPPEAILEHCIEEKIRYYQEAFDLIRGRGFQPETVGCFLADEILKGKIKYFKGQKNADYNTQAK